MGYLDGRCILQASLESYGGHLRPTEPRFQVYTDAGPEAASYPGLDPEFNDVGAEPGPSAAASTAEREHRLE
jgi:hypothetical protein